MKNQFKNQQGGFLQLILLIIILLLIMKFMGLTVSGLWYWFISLFRDVVR